MKSNKKIPLTQTLRKYKFLFDTLKSLSEGYIFLCDLSADIFFVSPNFSTDFNFSSEIMIGFVGHLAEIIHEDDRIFLNDLDNFLNAEETKNFTAEFRLLDKKNPHQLKSVGILYFCYFSNSAFFRSARTFLIVVRH